MDIKSEKPFEREKPKTPAPSPELKKDPAPTAAASKAVRTVIVAAISFSDALSGKSFRAGDEVEGWDEKRVNEYIKRGVVYRTTQTGPSEVK